MAIDSYKDMRCFVLFPKSPMEVYIVMIELDSPIEIENTDFSVEDEIIEKNCIVKGAVFILLKAEGNFLCQVLDDLKFDEMFCEIIVLNTDTKLKVDYRNLKEIKFNEDNLNAKNIVAVKMCDYIAYQPDIHNAVDSEKLCNWLKFRNCLVKYQSNYPDPGDGFFPVILKNMTTGSPILTDMFGDIADTTILSNEYEKSVRNEILNLFEKQPRHQTYVLSNPIIKTRPHIGTPSSEDSSRLNIEAKPFVPISSSFSLELTSEHKPRQQRLSLASPVFTPTTTTLKKLSTLKPISQSVSSSPSESGIALSHSIQNFIHSLQINSSSDLKAPALTSTSTPCGLLTPNTNDAVINNPFLVRQSPSGSLQLAASYQQNVGTSVNPFSSRGPSMTYPYSGVGFPGPTYRPQQQQLYATMLPFLATQQQQQKYYIAAPSAVDHATSPPVVAPNTTIPPPPPQNVTNICMQPVNVVYMNK